MEIRKPAVAGQFYEAGSEQCIAEVEQYIDCWRIDVELPEKISGGIVPHAGWAFSGDLAGAVFSSIEKINKQVDTFVIFGAAHRYIGHRAVVYDTGRWISPIAEIEIDEDLAAKIIATDCAAADKISHIQEHSIEVQVPFIQYLFPKAKLVPILVPCSGLAVVLGEETADIIRDEDKDIVCIASTDLTHYGPRYGFCPEGVGDEAIRWAKEVNDAGFIDLALQMKASQLLEGAEENASACGPGASAGLVSCMKRLGKKKGVLLGHTNSNEVLERKYHQRSEESVGYAGIVY